jgi:OmpA-OmpF porin, OOP family
MKLRMDKCLKGLAAALPLAGCAMQAAATESGWYVGASVGHTEFDVSDSSLFLPAGFPRLGGEDSSISQALSFGYRFTRYLGIEASYADLRQAEFSSSGLLFSTSIAGTRANGTSNIEFGVRGPSVAIVGSIPIHDWEIVAKIGALYAATRIEGRLDAIVTRSFGLPSFELHESVSESARTTEALVSVGVGYTFAEHYHVKLDWTGMRDVGDEEETAEADITVTSLGFQYRF